MLTEACAQQEFSDVRKKRNFYKKLLANVEECGFLEPTPIQRQAIPLMLKRREVLCVAPTGRRSFTIGTCSIPFSGAPL